MYWLFCTALQVLEMCMTNFDPNENEKVLIFVSMGNLKNCLSKNLQVLDFRFKYFETFRPTSIPNMKAIQCFV